MKKTLGALVDALGFGAVGLWAGSTEAGTVLCTVTGGGSCSTIAHSHTPYEVHVEVSGVTTTQTVTIRHPFSPVRSDVQVTVNPSLFTATPCSANLTVGGTTLSCTANDTYNLCQANTATSTVACAKKKTWIAANFKLETDSMP
jgi:hypothetical protein